MSTSQNPPDFWETLFSSALPKTHLYAAAAMAATLVLLLVLTPSRDVSAYRDANLLEIQIPTAKSLYQELNRQLAESQALEPASMAAPEPVLTWRVQKVKPGDNLSAI